jgi:hypothetical protein
MRAHLSDLLIDLPDASVTAPMEFTGVSTNSKAINKGNLFVAERLI